MIEVFFSHWLSLRFFIFCKQILSINYRQVPELGTSNNKKYVLYGIFLKEHDFVDNILNYIFENEKSVRDANLGAEDSLSLTVIGWCLLGAGHF